MTYVLWQNSQGEGLEAQAEAGSLVMMDSQTGSAIPRSLSWSPRRGSNAAPQSD